jgi:hypothetical protein
MKHRKLLLPALLLAVYAPLSMACSKPETPDLPDPATAVTPQMVKAQNDVKAYMDNANAYLKCKITDSQHNAMVKEMESLATKFNGIIRAYKERMAG